MVDIITYAHDLVQGILEPIRKEVFASALVGMDESPVKVLDDTLKGASHRGYFWTMGSQDAAMYPVESEARKSPEPMEAVAEARRTLMGPLLTSFWTWLAERSEHVLPKSSLGVAIHYALERKGALEKFLDDPRIPMDNNQSERDLRHVVIGRKNWNFAGSYAGAERLATFFTLKQSCKRVSLNPWAYLTHVFAIIEDYSSSRLEELTPSRVKATLQALS